MSDELDGGARPGSIGPISDEEGKFPFDAFEFDSGEKTDKPTLRLEREWSFEASRRYEGKSAAYTILDDDGVSLVGVTTGASGKTITLPTVSDNEGRTIRVMKMDDGEGTVTVDGEGDETINGGATVTLETQYAKVAVYSTGDEWVRLD